MSRVPLYEELRLVERNESEINGAWRGAHLLLFFLAFVFGSFCTFCFHMLMYLFDEKCVLFPKLLSLKSLKHNVIYEFFPSPKDVGVMPLDFVSTQWVEKSTCSLPTFVPLVSGIFGLVWTTIFLMCSAGSQTLTGLQRPWRVLPPVFVFSLAMGCLCIYTSIVTHYGLHELCLKLGEITGSHSCSFTVNVATLSYERRIRGVYQATRLTILSAWLHTACWLLSALLALVRVLLVVDFQLVRVSAQLHGDIDKILEQHEVQIRTILPEIYVNEENERADITTTYQATNDNSIDLVIKNQEMLSLIPKEMKRLPSAETYKLKQTDEIPATDPNSLVSIYAKGDTSTEMILKSQIQEIIESPANNEELAADSGQIKMIYHGPKEGEPRYDQTSEARGIQFRDESPQPSTSKHPPIEETNVTPETERIPYTTEDHKAKTRRKSNLKPIEVQTDKAKRGQHVQILEKSLAKTRSDLETETTDQTSTASRKKKDNDEKKPQKREKEKQD